MAFIKLPHPDGGYVILNTALIVGAEDNGDDKDEVVITMTDDSEWTVKGTIDDVLTKLVIGS